MDIACNLMDVQSAPEHASCFPRVCELLRRITDGSEAKDVIRVPPSFLIRLNHFRARVATLVRGSEQRVPGLPFLHHSSYHSYLRKSATMNETEKGNQSFSTETDSAPIAINIEFYETTRRTICMNTIIIQNVKFHFYASTELDQSLLLHVMLYTVRLKSIKIVSSVESRTVIDSSLWTERKLTTSAIKSISTMHDVITDTTK